MNLLNWLRRDRVAETLAEHRLREEFLAEAERLWPGTDSDELNEKDCAPLRCDLEDNYVCARHRNGW